MNKKIIKRLLKDIPPYSSVLDVGSGIGDFSKPFINRVTIDAWKDVNPDIWIDLEKDDLYYGENSFEYVLMIDFIEHLSKERGIIILEQVKKIVSKRIYLLTPLWWDNNEKNVYSIKGWSYGNIYNLHKSLWIKQDFSDWKEIGFKTIDGEYYWGYWEKNV